MFYGVIRWKCVLLGAYNTASIEALPSSISLVFCFSCCFTLFSGRNWLRCVVFCYVLAVVYRPFICGNKWPTFICIMCCHYRQHSRLFVMLNGCGRDRLKLPQWLVMWWVG
eukprot:TsM_000344100 transcript=TsM_000344100 gene=TsM_000344100